MNGLVELAEGVNFRDIGGLPISGGRIRSARIYRSGRLNRLTSADRNRLEQLGIRLICDLRGWAEQAHEPYRWLPAGARMLEWGASSHGDVTKLSDQLDRGSTTADGRRVMIGLYRRLAESHADRYALAFRALAAGEVPAVIACTAGKDRTGMAIAILLELIGASRATTIENYALSEQLHDFMDMFHKEAEAAERDGRPDSAYLNLVRTVSRDALRTILASDPDYVAAALAQIEATYGSIAGYAQTRLGLTDDEIMSLRRHLIA